MIREQNKRVFYDAKWRDSRCMAEFGGQPIATAQVERWLGRLMRCDAGIGRSPALTAQ